MYGIRAILVVRFTKRDCVKVAGLAAAIAVVDYVVRIVGRQSAADNAGQHFDLGHIGKPILPGLAGPVRLALGRNLAQGRFSFDRAALQIQPSHRWQSRVFRLAIS